jgi:hypothetical protein
MFEGDGVVKGVVRESVEDVRESEISMEGSR